MTTLFYIGKKFHRESRGLMSVLYSTAGKRYTWADVRWILASGQTVYVRPATSEETARCAAILERLKLTSLYKEEGSIYGHERVA